MRASWVQRSLLGAPAWVWLLGLAGALVVMGPALAPGPLLNLDLVAVPDPPVPRGVWGLGPELPRRVPMWVPVAWLAPLLGGDLVTKVLMVAGLTVAFAGMHRLARDAGTLAALGAATLYAFGPFVLTRLAVGHLHVVLTAALLPWALADLLAPDRSLRRTFLWSAALGFTGNVGGATAGLVVLAGLVARRGRRAPAVVAAGVAAQLPWLVPLVVVTAVSGPELADASAFPTRLDGVDGVGGLLAGHGFWNPPFQVGAPGGWAVALVGFVLLALAVFGSTLLPDAIRRPLLALAAIGFVISAASGVPALQDLTAWISRTALGAPFRESQRLLVVFVLWLAPAAAFGAARLARSVQRPTAVAVATAAVPLVLGLFLAAPGAWGAGGQLRPTPYPDEWARARELVTAEPGTLVAFPWYQYFTFDVAGNRLVLNTAPLYFGGDVLVSSDPGIGAGRSGGSPRERGDRRERRVDLLVGKVKQGGAISRDLEDLGVRWVALMKDVDGPRYEPGLTADAGLERVVDGPTLSLYRVRAWRGPVFTEDGRSIPAELTTGPVYSVDASGPARLAEPGTSGWLRGTSAATVTADGLVQLPDGSGLVWYWPAVVVLAADLVWLGLVGAALRRRYPAVEHGAAGGGDAEKVP